MPKRQEAYMFWEPESCFSKQHTSTPIASPRNGFAVRALNSPKQRRPATAHTHSLSAIPCTFKEGRMKLQNGFTLPEIMIVVALVGILAAIAMPSYSSYMIRGNRAAAQAFMLDVASREKQYLLDARAYTSSLVTLGVTAPTDVSRNYTIAICLNPVVAQCATAATPPYFNITATPVVGGKQASDGAVTLSSDGAKTPAAKW